MMHCIVVITKIFKFYLQLEINVEGINLTELKIEEFKVNVYVVS